MSTKKAKKRLSAKDVLEMMQRAAAEGMFEVDFRHMEFDDLQLAACIIPVSLDCKGAIFHGSINLVGSKFLGGFIDLDDARITGGLYLNSLKSKNGYSLYLRRARVD